MDFMFRMIWLSDSSKMKKRHFSFRLHAASTNVAAMLVLPVPACPETRIDDPR